MVPYRVPWRDGPASIKALWQFARGDLSADEFQMWLFDTAEIDGTLDKTAYLHLLDFDYRNERDAANARAYMRDVLRALPHESCECLEWCDRQKIPIGFDTDAEWFDTRFDVIRSRTPWLQSVRCRGCSEYWYVATDTVDDDYYFHRITPQVAGRTCLGEWPPDFEGIDPFWPTEEWLRIHGFGSLAEWQRTNGGA